MSNLSAQQRKEAVSANINMMRLVIRSVEDRLETAQSDLVEGNMNAAVGGLTGFDEQLKKLSSLYDALMVAHRFQD